MKRRVARWLSALAERADEVLYERALAHISWHQDEIGRLQAEAAGPTAPEAEA